jgi:hypothetical protein
MKLYLRRRHPAYTNYIKYKLGLLAYCLFDFLNFINYLTEFAKSS